MADLEKLWVRPQLGFDGFGSLTVFNKDCRRLAVAAGVPPAAAGDLRLRWLPTFDIDFENRKDLQQHLLGPFSRPYRAELLRKLVTWRCSMCGESTGEVKPIVCEYGATSCKVCVREDAHRLVLGCWFPAYLCFGICQAHIGVLSIKK